MTPRVRRASTLEVLPLRHEVLRAGLPLSTAHFVGDDAPTTRHWLAERDGVVCCVASVFEARGPTPELADCAWQLRGMATAASVRGQGVGSSLLALVEKEVGAPLWCNARLSALGFYESLGWVSFGAPFDIPTAGPHLRMRKG